MPVQLQLADGFTLPAETVTETIAILAKRGAGKTYTASVLVEELIGAGLPTVVIDPVGVWWGLRSSADGTGPGLPVTILGGEHADLPLSPESGAAVADLVVEERLPLVLDLSLMSKTQQRRWVCDFLERLYHRNREPLHVVIDEADLYAPQRANASAARLLGAYEDVVRRGRARGLGCTSITQRPASLHTDIRSQAEVLIALRMTGAHDIGAVEDWVRLHAEPDQAREVTASLPSLPVGTAWVWSPGWLEILTQIQVRKRRTFDSSATPKPGQRLITPQEFAAVHDSDLARVRDRLGTVEEPVESAPSSGARASGRELARLREELAAERSRPRPVERIEVPVLSDHAAETLRETATRLETVVAELRRVLSGAQPTSSPDVKPARRDEPLAPRRSAERPAQHGQVKLKAGARRMLDVLARQHPLRVTRAQLATLAGLKVTGGTFNTYFSVLRSSDLITMDGPLVVLTDRGRTEVGVPDSAEPISSDEIRDQWMAVLKAGARTMLGIVLNQWPEPIARTDLAAAAQLEPSGGTFNTYLSTLRSNGLVQVHGSLVLASDVFFLDRAPAA